VDSISCGLASRYFDSAGIVPQLSDHTRVRCGKNDVDNSARFDRQRATIGDDKFSIGRREDRPAVRQTIIFGHSSSPSNEGEAERVRPANSLAPELCRQEEAACSFGFRKAQPCAARLNGRRSGA
jgi:hypothetical protein